MCRDDTQKALILALTSQHDQCLETLLKSISDVNKADGNGNVPLLKAIEVGYLHGVKGLLKAGADVNKMHGSNQDKALEAAALKGHVECVKALIEAGADVNMVKGDESSMCSIVAAVKSGSKRCVETLIKAGANVNLKCKHRRWNYDINALVEAIFHKNVDIVQMLVEAGADVNSHQGLTSPLTLASEVGLCKAVELLLHAGADVNDQWRCMYGTPLMHAVRFSFSEHPPINYLNCMELLIDAGADVNAIDIHYSTALTTAVKVGFDEGVDLLLRSGGNEGLSKALTAAVGTGFPKCAQLLVDAGADVNEDQGYDHRPLSQLGCVRNLIGTEDIDDEDLLQKALSKINLVECGKILLRAGAKINVKNWRDHNNALRHYIGINREHPQREICMLLYAAGETLQGTTVAVSDPNWHPKESAEPDKFYAKVPEYLLFEDLKFNLKHLCRQAIRNHLLNLDPHQHLFGKIPHLGIPPPLTKYLLFNFSL